MFDFNKPNIEITDISDDKKYGRFVVEPLERGYGTTLGNSLRRIHLYLVQQSARLRLTVFFMSSVLFRVLRKMSLRLS